MEESAPIPCRWVLYDEAEIAASWRLRSGATSGALLFLIRSVELFDVSASAPGWQDKAAGFLRLEWEKWEGEEPLLITETSPITTGHTIRIEARLPGGLETRLTFIDLFEPDVLRPGGLFALNSGLPSGIERLALKSQKTQRLFWRPLLALQNLREIIAIERPDLLLRLITIQDKALRAGFLIEEETAVSEADLRLRPTGKIRLSRHSLKTDPILIGTWETVREAQLFPGPDRDIYFSAKPLEAFFAKTEEALLSESLLSQEMPEGAGALPPRRV